MKAEMDNLFYHFFGVLLAMLLMKSLRPSLLQVLSSHVGSIRTSTSESLAGAFIDQRAATGSEE
ncbi:MAG: hypothetical protein IPM63_05165 [Acidobacteriota bacterium]|nr:MAG: hypothetical protein IPM63_05165 [Acidobacteriota bacterium]